MYQTYTVKAGDTLYGISNQFGVSVNELATLNNVSAKNLRIGSVLKIPSKSGTNPDNVFIYTVQKGDTLYSIAKRYNTTVQNISSLNNLSGINLSIGQELKIPESYDNSSNQVLPSFINYIVKKGDTLYSIAHLYNLSVDDLIKDNNLNSNVLSVGQNLKIRTFEEIIEECYGEEYISQNEPDYINYIVKKGDSLYKIASNYNTTVNAIMSLNNLNSTNLSVGQELKIPGLIGGFIYTVKRGDNLYSIAKSFNTSVESIKNKNNLKTNLLSIGQELII